jgi:hypothetical protein
VRDLRRFEIGRPGALVIAIPVALAIGLWCYVPPSEWWQTGAEGVVGVLLVAVLVGLAALVARNLGKQSSGTRPFVLICILATLLGGALAGNLLHATARESAHRYCDALMPLLEAQKRSTGKYPTEIAPLLPRDVVTPWIIQHQLDRGSPIYERVGDSYMFRVEDWDCGPGLMFWFDPSD